MKTLKKHLKQCLLPMVAVLVLGMGCGEDVAQNCDGDNAQPIETFYESDFEEVNCQLQNTDANGKEVHLIIKNQDEYETYFSCIDGLPAIDFDDYIILAGVYSHHQCAIFDRQSLVICDNQLIYRVRLQEQDCFALTDIQYFTVLSKVHESNEIKFDVQFSN
jgi:hypothetical protein